MEEITSELNWTPTLHKSGSNLSGLSWRLPTVIKSDEIPPEVDSASLRLFYIDNLVEWLNSFEGLVANKLITSLAVLISPVVSSSTAIDEIEAPKSFGYIEGLCLTLRQCFDDYRISLTNRASTQTPPIHLDLHLLLDDIDDLNKKLHSKATKVDPILQKMLYSISRFKRKLPHDLTFLDSEIQELSDNSDAAEITLSIWKSWIENPYIDVGSYNLEVQWDSSNPEEIVIQELSTMKQFSNSAQSTNIQTKLIHHLLTLIMKRLEESLKQLTDIESDVNTCKEILKRAYRRVHEDEQDCTISPSTFYIIMRYFENYIKIAVTCFKEISTNISIIKSLVWVGRKSLKKKSAYPNATMFQYPKDTHIVISFEAGLTLLTDLVSEENQNESIFQRKGFQNFKLPEDGSSRSVMILWFNNAISRLASRKTSSVGVNSIISKRGSGWTWNKGKSFLHGKFAKLPSNTISSEDNFLQSSSLPTLEETILPNLTATLNMLKNPNASLLEEVEIENILGLSMLLASMIVHLNYYREVPASHRHDLEVTFQRVDSRLQKLSNPPLHDDIASSLNKLKALIISLERSLSYTFGLEDDGTIQITLSQVETTTPSHQINEDVSTFSDNIADHIAAKNGNHLWQAVCGTDAEGEGGIIFKNPNSHDALTFARLSVFKRVEVIISLLKLIDDIVTISEDSAITVLQQLSKVRTNLKSRINGLETTVRNGDLTRLNVDKIQVPLHKYKDICHKLAQLSEDIFILLDFVADVVKDLKLYVSLTFKLLKMPIKSAESSVTKINRKQSPMQMYHKEMEKNVIEMELAFRNLVETPFSVSLPLKFTAVNGESFD